MSGLASPEIGAQEAERWNFISTTQAWIGGTASVNRTVRAGTYLEAPLILPAGPLLRCARPQPRARPAADDVIPNETEPGHLRFRATSLIVGQSAQAERDDIVVRVDGRVLPIGPFRQDEAIAHDTDRGTLREVWYEASVPAESSAWDEMRNGNTISIGSSQTVGMTFPLRGSSAAIGQLIRFCADQVWPWQGQRGTGTAQDRARQTQGSVRDILRTHFGPHIVSFNWLASPPDPDGSGDALAFVYSERPDSGNSSTLDVALFRVEPGGARLIGRINGVFGHQPRNAAFDPDVIEVTTTTLRQGDPRCCPTGATRWRIDRRSLIASTSGGAPSGPRPGAAPRSGRVPGDGGADFRAPRPAAPPAPADVQPPPQAWALPPQLPGLTAAPEAPPAAGPIPLAGQGGATAEALPRAVQQQLAMLGGVFSTPGIVGVGFAVAVPSFQGGGTPAPEPFAVPVAVRFYSLDLIRARRGAASPVLVAERAEQVLLGAPGNTGVFTVERPGLRPPTMAAVCIVHETPAAPGRLAMRLNLLRATGGPGGVYNQIAPARARWAEGPDPCGAALQGLDEAELRPILAP